MFFVYIVKNQQTGKIYIGQTSNLRERLKRHNGLLPIKERSYTSVNKGLWKVVYNENYTTREEAMRREKYLKSHIGRDWLRETVLGP